MKNHLLGGCSLWYSEVLLCIYNSDTPFWKLWIPYTVFAFILHPQFTLHLVVIDAEQFVIWCMFCWRTITSILRNSIPFACDCSMSLILCIRRNREQIYLVNYWEIFQSSPNHPANYFPLICITGKITRLMQKYMMITLVSHITRLTHLLGWSYSRCDKRTLTMQPVTWLEMI